MVEEQADLVLIEWSAVERLAKLLPHDEAIRLILATRNGDGSRWTQQDAENILRGIMATQRPG